MSPGCLKCVLRVQGCSKGILRIFQECFKDLLRLFQASKLISSVVQESFKGGSRVFQGVSIKCQGCFMEISRVLGNFMFMYKFSPTPC